MRGRKIMNVDLWTAESVFIFSVFKRNFGFGEHVKPVRWKNMVKELMLKVLYATCSLQ